MELTREEQQKLGDLLGGSCSESRVVGICPVKDVIARFGDKWSLYVLLVLGQGVQFRFSTIKELVPGISQRMLTVTLRSLEEDGLVGRKAYAEIPPRVEYSLSELGISLVKQLVVLGQWAQEHFPQIEASRKRFSVGG